jgi:hypothetical protein
MTRIMSVQASTVAPAVVVAVLEQHVADERRIRDKMAPREPDLERHDTPLPGAADKLTQRIRRQRGEIAADQSCEDARHGRPFMSRCTLAWSSITIQRG